MSSEDISPQDESRDTEMAKPSDVSADVGGTAPSGATDSKKRPRIDVSALTGGAGAGRERKRGKSMFGLVLGTLNKAKIEDKERSASEAAKKRHLIDQRLQAKLRKETDSVRRAEEAKKEKTSANRREEELQLKDSIYKLRRTRLPILSNFLLTSDVIPVRVRVQHRASPRSPSESSPVVSAIDPLAPPPRTHPPPLYYLPAILTPAQEAFLARRKSAVERAAEEEWKAWIGEREEGVRKVGEMRRRVREEEEARARARQGEGVGAGVDEDDDMDGGDRVRVKEKEKEKEKGEKEKDEMDVDDAAKTTNGRGREEEEKEEHTAGASGRVDDDEAVEY